MASTRNNFTLTYNRGNNARHSFGQVILVVVQFIVYYLGHFDFLCEKTIKREPNLGSMAQGTVFYDLSLRQAIVKITQVITSN